MGNAEINQTPNTSDLPIIVIEPGRIGLIDTLTEIWQYRELFFFLAWRDVSVRYKQTVLGIIWVVLQPLSAMLIFTLIFNRLAKINSGDIPYPIFVLVGQVAWDFFAGSLNRSGDSLVTNTRLITKVYFPRILVPASAALAALVDFAITLILLCAVMLYYRFVPGIEVLAMPFLVALMFIFSVSIGMIFSAANVRFRDFKFILGFLIQMWMYATPVVYPYKMLVERFPSLETAILLNPMVGVVEGFRWALLGQPFPRVALIFSAAVTLICLIFAQAYFRSVERTFADVI